MIRCTCQSCFYFQNSIGVPAALHFLFVYIASFFLVVVFYLLILQGVLNVVMGNAPDIGDALLASPQVFYPLTWNSVLLPQYIMIDFLLEINGCIIDRMFLYSCFLLLIQVRKITFTGSTAVGKKLMAGAAGTVKRVWIFYEMDIFAKPVWLWKLWCSWLPIFWNLLDIAWTWW